MDKKVTEWQILFSMTSGKDDFYTEDENEYKEYFQELKDNNELNEIEQCIKKTYIWNDEVEDWEEDWVDVLYDGVMNLEETKYNIYTTSGENGVYNTTLYDTVDSEEQASDIVSELQAQGLGADYEKVDEEYTKTPKKLEEDETPSIVSYNLTNGGYGNNQDTVYGKLSDNTGYIYEPETDTVTIYDEVPIELLHVLFYNSENEDELLDDEYQRLVQEYQDEHLIKSLYSGPLVQELHNRYFADDEVEEILDENLDKTPDIVAYNVTDGGYVNNANTVYGKLSDGTYFVYYTEMDLVETYDCEPDELLEILYADEDELPAEAREEAFNEFFEQHNVDTYGPGDELYEKLHKLYYEEDSLEEAKTDNSSKLNIEYVTPNYTGGGIYVYTGKFKNGNYFIADDTYFGKEGNTFSPFDIRVVDTDPDKVYTDEEGLEYTLLDDMVYQEQHLVEDIEDDNAKELTKEILQWIITNKPEGNYQMGEMQEYLDITNKSNKVEETKSYTLSLIPDDLYKVLLNIQEMYQEDLLNSDEDIFANTEDSYAVEMLYNNLADIITTPIYRKYRNENYKVANPDKIDMKVDNYIINALGTIIREDKLEEYRLKNTITENNISYYIDEYYPSKTQAEQAERKFKDQGKSAYIKQIDNEYAVYVSYEPLKTETFNIKNAGKDKSDFKQMLKTFDNNGKYAKRGNWEIGRGGYDLWYEVSYNKVPVIGCTAGKVSAYQKGFEEYAKLVAEEYGDTYIDTLTEGKVTTTSGTYDTKKYDEICNKVKQAYKDAWEGKISYSDLEDIKKNSGLSSGELSSVQYMASRETDKKEETKQQENPTIKFVGKLSKDDTTFPIKLLGSNIFQYKDITVEEIFDSVKDILASYKSKSVNIEIVEQKDIDYNMLNTDFSHTALTKYTLKRDSQVCYALEEFNGIGDEENTTTYITNKEIPDNEINNFILALDNYYNKVFSNSTLKEETKHYNITDNTKFISYEPDMEGTYTMSDMKKVYNTKVSDEYKKEGSDFKDWLDDMLKSGVYEIVEAKTKGIFDKKDMKSYLVDISKAVANVVSKSAKSASIEIPNKGELMNNNSVIVYELPTRFTGDMVGLGEEIAKQLYSDLESGRVKEVKCVPTHTKKGQVLTLSIIGPDIVSVEENKSLSTLKSKLTDKINKILQTPEYGFEPNEISQYTVIEIKPLNDTETKVEIRVELSYEALNGLIEELNPIVQQYDKEAYFDIEEPGIASAIISTRKNKITEEETESVNTKIHNLIRQINDWYKANNIDKVVLYEETPNYGIVSTNILDKELYDKYGTTAYTPEDEQVFNQDGFGYAVIKYLEDYLKKLSTYKVTENENFDERVQQIVADLKEEPLVKKYLYDTTWLSGSSTTVYPIEIGKEDITLQWKSDKNVFNSFIKRIVDKYPEISDGWFNQTDGEEPSSITFKLVQKRYENKKITEDIDTEEIKDKVEQEKQETGIKDDIDTEEEVKTATKKEVYQYAKQQGLDLEKLRKQGIDLSEVEETLDKVIGNMVSKSIIEYEDKTGKSVVWDYKVTNNDIDIIISEI